MKAPKTLHRALTIALRDLEKVEKDPVYKVDFDSTWHDTIENKCHVCFAGAIMAKTFKSNPSYYLHPGRFSRGWEKIFRALNYIRCNEWCEASDFYETDGPKMHKLLDLDEVLPVIPDYYNNRAGFKKAIRKTIRVLKKHNL